MIVGSGVLGLMTAIRLAEAGHRVTVVEGSSTLGNGATSQNLGGIQSGIVYFPKFPACVEPFKQGVTHYAAMFPRAKVNEQPKWYVGPPADVTTLRNRLDQFSIYYRDVPTKERLDIFRVGHHEEFDAVEVIHEFVASSHRVLLDLAQRCKNLGVRLLRGEPVKEIPIGANGHAIGVRTTAHTHVADDIVLASGFGTPAIVETIDRQINPGTNCLGQHFAVSHGTIFLTQTRNPPLRRPIHSVNTDALPSLFPVRNGHVYIVNSNSNLEARDWSSISPYQSSFVDTTRSTMTYHAADLKCDPIGPASTETIPLWAVMGPELTGVPNVSIGNPGRMTYAPVASKELADVVHGSGTGPVVMGPFLERIELSTVRLVTPPTWAHGGVIERSAGIDQQDCTTRILGIRGRSR
jgi:glycine/D-amino acid oxidase-like deaminating enzyme